MTARARVVLFVSFASVLIAGVLFYNVSSQSVSRAQANTGDKISRTDTAAMATPFFGKVTSRDNDFFYRSLLHIYGERYVPSSAAGTGRFSLGQKGGAKASAIRPVASRQIDNDPAAPTGAKGIRGLLNGDITVDQNVDTAPQQRQIVPDVVAMVGPVSEDRDIRDLPNIPAGKESGEVPLRRHTVDEIKAHGYPSSALLDAAIQHDAPVAPNMPAPLQTFAGINSATSGCGCLPPDTDGDVGPNHYIQSVNSSIRIFDKAGTALAPATTYNSFFSGLAATATPCGLNQNDGDGVVFYDHVADRWVVSDFAFPAFPGASFYQCIGVSKTADPVAGGWWLYAVQVDPANPTFLGDYPKFGMWPDAYYMSVNMFSNNTTFNGVRVYAFNRAAMISGGAASTVAFNILPADLGDQYSLVPASYRSGLTPPVGQAELFMDINSSAVAGTVENQVFVRRFHVDFATPANSTFGVGATHAPNGTIGVNGFVDAFTSGGTNIVPQPVTTRLLDTLGDKLMYPLVYQNLAGVESIWAAHTVNNNQAGTGPTGIRWYQFNVTGNTIPATPAQQQTFTNGADGAWRFMPSINVDKQGNMAIGYATSSGSVEPAIRYAGRLAGDPANTLGQGEATMIAGGGHQTSSSGRWGDYSTMFVDPTDNCTFFHTNEYFTATASAAWATRVGSFRFAGCPAVVSAAGVHVAGRVTNTGGMGIANARLTISGPGGQKLAITNSFGYFSFDDIEAGSSYLITVQAKRYSFTPQLIQVTDSMSDLAFTSDQ
jgi:adhesin HecA-like repeat protein